MTDQRVHALMMDTQSDLADPPFLLRSAEPNGFFRANASYLARVGQSEAELIAKPFLDWIDPKDHDAAIAVLEGKCAECRVMHLTGVAENLPLEIRSVVQDGSRVVLARNYEVEEQANGPDDVDDEASISGTLHTIARIVEEQNPGFKCSILLVADGKFVRGAGPSLPESYNEAIDGFAVGPTVGSCGTAIFWNVPVNVADIQADPLWAPFAELAKEAGVAACWSHPFVSKSGNVLGALALYSPEPKSPSKEQLSRVRAAARMTGLAVERGRAEEAFRAQRKREVELEGQLRQAAKMEALGVLAGGVAHDFNNLLSTVLGNAELAADLIEEGADVQELLTDIVQASKRAGQFCQQMLAYAGRGTQANERVEIGALIPELSSLVQAAISKKTTLEYALLDKPAYVDGDGSQLLQVVMNLVTNAAEAIGDSEGRIVVRSELASFEREELQSIDPKADLSSGEYICVSVSDTGSGMDEDTIAKIFDPFYTTKFTGRGLGLSGVKGIVGRHKGTIRIESEIGKGTTFTVLLPTVQRVQRVQRSDDPVESVDKDLGMKRILVVDDERSVLRTLSRRLQFADFEVLEALDGQEALDVYNEHLASIDCVLLDLSMPKLSGEEVYRILRSHRADLPIIMMSGYSEQEVVNRFREDGMTGFLQKPVTSDQLIEAIRKALDGAPVVTAD